MNNKILDFKRMIGYAIKAPSGHNTQPWLFRIKEGEDRIRIVPDLTKELPVVDKDCRELFISLGCAAENLCIAAKDMGYEPAVTIDEYNTINVYLKKTGVAKPDSLCLQIDRPIVANMIRVLSRKMRYGNSGRFLWRIMYMLTSGETRRRFLIY